MSRLRAPLGAGGGDQISPILILAYGVGEGVIGAGRAMPMTLPTGMARRIAEPH